MLLLLLVNFVSGFTLKSMNIPLIINIRSSLTHLHGFQLLVLPPYFIEISFFVCTNRMNLLNLKESPDRLVIVTKGFLKLPNLHMLIKQESITSQKLGSRDFYRIADSVLHKGKYTIPPLFNSPECCLPHLIKQNCPLKTFLRTHILMTQVSLYPFSPLELI